MAGFTDKLQVEAKMLANPGWFLGVLETNLTQGKLDAIEQACALSTEEKLEAARGMRRYARKLNLAESVAAADAEIERLKTESANGGGRA